MSDYRIVLPHPWERIGLDVSMERRVDEIVDAAVARAAFDVSPDQRAKARIRLREGLLRQLRESREHGGVDYYLPTDLVAGDRLNASFLVSVVIPDAVADGAETAQVLAALVAQSEDNRPVDAGGSVWVRAVERVERPADDVVGEDVRAVKVEYLTAVPGDERRWVVVAFTTFGDGDLESRMTTATIDLFDAMMSTWRWTDGA